MDMQAAITPKSDQLNSDDLIGRSLTIAVTKVSIASGEQPVSIYYEGDRGKPYKPCKSMCRVLVQGWGNDTSKYAGRSMTLYRDPSVKWGGMEVGGIRISHMSDIDNTMSMALTATKGVKKVFTVRRLVAAPPPAAAQSGPDGWPMLAPNGSLKAAPSADKWTQWCKVAIAKLEDVGALDAWHAAMQPHFGALREFDADAVTAVDMAARDRRAAMVMARDAEP